jgi:spore coat polysaccharide biosynthesis predicted glycosyltransferase SpsG
MGGIDAVYAVSDVLRAISRLPNARNLTVSIAISGRAPHLKELQNLVAELLFQATLFIDSAEIANLMLKADLAISTSGMMGYELACMGLPMLLLPTSPIQAKVAKELALQTEARVVADWAIYPEDNIFLALTSFLQHLKDLPFEKRLVSRTFDGAGASRVALALAERFGAQ